MDRIERRTKFSQLFGTSEGYLNSFLLLIFKGMRCTHPKKSLGGFDRFFFVHPKDISVHLFLDSQAEWNAVRFPIWGLLLGTYINDPFLSFFFKNYKTHIIRQRQRKSNCISFSLRIKKQMNWYIFWMNKKKSIKAT